MKVTDSGTERRFTTFEVGRICGVFHTTVINWVNKGKLKAQTTPGGHRRIAASDLVDFMRRFDMPVPADLEARRRRILVVEDDPGVQRMLTRALHALPGVAIEACWGGLEALVAIGKEAPDLLVLDIRIPQVDGFEVLRLLRSNEQLHPIKVIVVSGESLRTEETARISEDADAFFPKPVPLSEFRKAAAELLGVEAEAR
jgi:CheY-like chemotaxis protein